MRTKIKLALVLIMLSGLPLVVRAQSYWVVSYQGTATASGTNKLDTISTTENEFIEEAATKAGVSTADLVLVLHLNANELGDTLEVVNQNDPNLFHYEIFKFTYKFSGSPSQSYTNSDGTVVKRFAYIFGNDDSHSRGSVILNERTTSGKGKGADLAGISGTLQFWRGIWQADAPDPDAIVCSGTFKATKPLNPP